MSLPPIPESLRVLMAKIGPRWEVNRADNIALMIKEFSEVLKDSPRDRVAVRHDIPYDAHPRQQVDLYLPEDGRTKRAALVFVHGGAFMDGDRNRTDFIYSNVPVYFARNGVVGVNIGYRLGGDARYPGATEDVAKAVAWTRAHTDELGIDSNRIFLMGHSAGAAHAASYAYDQRRHPPEGPGIAGLIVLSGRVRADNRPENPNADKVVAYYETTDQAKLDDVSPVSHVGPNSVPTFIGWGEYENPLLDVHCAELVFRLAVAKKRTPPVIWLRGHNHTSTIAHIGTADQELGHAILAFIAHPR